MPEQSLAHGPPDTRPQSPYWDELLVRALSGDGVRAVYQPIIDLGRLATVGYEALARFDLAPGLTPDRWFAAAALRNLVPELEAATLRAAFRARATMPRHTFLTVNIEPESLFSKSIERVLAEQGDLHGVVVEITEHRPLGEVDRVSARLQELRDAGARIAVDDAGAGHSGLQQILTLRPSILKLDRSLVASLDRDQAKAALVEMIGLFAGRIDGCLLAEGVETLGEAQRLMELNVPLAQGYLFARPEKPWIDLNPDVRDRLLRHAESCQGQPLLTLVEPIITYGLEELDRARLDVLSGDVAMAAIVDRDQRALGLLDAVHARRGELLQPLRSNVQATPTELATRLATRVPADTTSPAIATDEHGRLLGIVTVARLLGHLGRDLAA